MLRAQPMKRRSPALLAGLVLGGVVLLALSAPDRREPRSAETVAPTTEPQATKPEAAEEDEPEEADESEVANTTTPEEMSVASRRFQTMADGSPVPALPADAPSRIKIGVALFRYQGAEAPPKSSRSKDEANRLAKQAAQAAKSDFAAAVKLGDRGSSENIGWLSRGILEPAVEFAVFSLKKDEVSQEPIDTPRGYWVVRRIH